MVDIKKLKRDKFIDNDIWFYNNEDKSIITDKLMYKLINVFKDYKLLYFSFYNKKEDLYNKYKDLNLLDIKIIDGFTPIDDIEQYIKNNKVDCVCIDYYKMVSTNKYFMVNGKRLNILLNEIERLSKIYEVYFIVVINKEN